MAYLVFQHFCGCGLKVLRDCCVQFQRHMDKRSLYIRIVVFVKRAGFRAEIETIGHLVHTILPVKIVCVCMYWRMLWNGNESGKHLGNEDLTAIIHNTDRDRPKRTGECGMFKLFELHGNT